MKLMIKDISVYDDDEAIEVGVVIITNKGDPLLSTILIDIDDYKDQAIANAVSDLLDQSRLTKNN